MVYNRILWGHTAVYRYIRTIYTVMYVMYTVLSALSVPLYTSSILTLYWLNTDWILTLYADSILTLYWLYTDSTLTLSLRLNTVHIKDDSKDFKLIFIPSRWPAPRKPVHSRPRGLEQGSACRESGSRVAANFWSRWGFAIQKSLTPLTIRVRVDSAVLRNRLDPAKTEKLSMWTATRRPRKKAQQSTSS